MKNIIIIFILLLQVGCASDKYYYNYNQKENLTPNTSILRNNSAVDYYQNDKGVVLGVSNKLIVKFKDTLNLTHYLNEFNLTIGKELGKNLFILKVLDKSLTIDISNRLSEMDDIEYAHPDFSKKIMSR